MSSELIELSFSTYGDGLACDVQLPTNNQREPWRIHERFVVEGNSEEDLQRLWMKVSESVEKIIQPLIER